MPDEKLNAILQTAIRAAKAGGELALERRSNPGYIRIKGLRDIQAGAVIDIQQRIVDVIKSDYPDHNFLLEEKDEPQDAQADPLWIIDPIDGSMNFNYGLPLFAVSIAFRSDDRYQVGVVYDPCNNELYEASLNGGARLNGEPIYVKKVSEGDEAFRQSLIGSDLPGETEDRKLALYINRILANEVQQIWTLGASSLGLCYVAAGRFHSYYALKLDLWDVAAASVILRESGATFTDIQGASWHFSKGGYLATNGVIHGAVLRATKPMMEIYLARLTQPSLTQQKPA